MRVTNNLPNGPKMPVFLRRLKFIFQPVEYVEGFAKKYGDTFTLWGRNDSPLVYFSHPQALQQIFTADSGLLDAGRGNQDLRFLLGSNSLLLLDGDRHQSQRQLLTPPFHGDVSRQDPKGLRMRAYGETIREITQQVGDEWKMGQSFNIRASMQEITLRVILRVVFGLDEGPRLEKIRQLLSALMDSTTSSFMSVGLFFGFMQKDLGAWSPWGRVLRLRQQVDEIIYELIQERRTESGQNRQDILSLLMSARYDDGQPMSDEELRDELMTLMVAGHETTASALTWAFYWIDFLPQVRDKLLKELDTLGDKPDLNTIAKLPYLTAICQETLRIYPIAMNAFPRIVRSPIEIQGYTLPQGTVILPSIYLAHHREETYPQSKQFRPERFLERQFSPYEYLPFGGGNRRCIGLAFAQYEMKLVLATILSRFQVSLVNKRPVRPVRRGLTLAPPAGMQMVATPMAKRATTVGKQFAT
ncbi:cytochrome P450 [Nostocales cyanobacterium HT-58-2]|nr:cytochrome P450 [Nostocales cyanobacterium HT-58-2]